MRHWKTPIILQLEAVECGAASLCMVLGYYGYNISIDKMRDELQVSRDGSSVKNIVNAAKNHKLEGRGKLLSVKKLINQQPFPCIVLWDNCHFLVCERYKNGCFYINDPACGRLKLTLDEFESHFSYTVITFKPQKDFEYKKKEYRESKYFFAQLSQLKGNLGYLAILAFIYTILSLTVPLFGKVFIDDYFNKRYSFLVVTYGWDNDFYCFWSICYYSNNTSNIKTVKLLRFITVELFYYSSFISLACLIF